MKNSNFKVKVTANGLNIQNKETGATLKIVKTEDGFVIDKSKLTEEKDVQYGTYLGKAVRQGIEKLTSGRKKVPLKNAITQVSEVINGLEGVNSFRNLSNRFRKQGNSMKLFGEELFHEQCA